jgi:hypothetical protein
MIHPFTPHVLHEASRTRPVYDNPPVIVDAPWFARTRAIVARLVPAARRPEPAPAPQPTCSVQSPLA